LFVNAAANTFSQFATDGDGNILSFASAGAGEGVISISGTTTTYGGFTGTHWSRLADNSKPTILRGTLMESLDEMCDWYQAVADVAEVKYIAEDEEVKSGSKNVGDVKKPAYTKRVPITLPDGKAVGDAVTFTFQGETHTGVYEKETDIKHVKCKISDTTDSKKIYGLFSHWDSGFDYLDDDVNDMNIAQVGTFIIRVNKDVTVEAGDLLVSNGDGTAKLQDDDIIRSKTVAKVNSNIKVETYEDGSYTVPCTLHC
jgi:plastocyanin